MMMVVKMMVVVVMKKEKNRDHQALHDSFDIYFVSIFRNKMVMMVIKEIMTKSEGDTFIWIN